MTHLLQYICQSNTGDRDIVARGDSIQNFRHLFLAPNHQGRRDLTGTGILLARRLEVPTAKNTEWLKCHSLRLTHWNNLSLQVTFLSRVAALVDREWSEAVLASIHVGFCDNPGRRVTDAEVQDFALVDKSIQRVHQLGNLGREVPAMYVELKRGLDRLFASKRF